MKKKMKIYFLNDIQIKYIKMIKLWHPFSRFIYTRPYPPPNHTDFFLIGVLIGFITGTNYPSPYLKIDIPPPKNVKKKE